MVRCADKQAASTWSVPHRIPTNPPPASHDDDQQYLVVRNECEQYGLWPVGLKVPPGWNPVGIEGSGNDCMAYVRQVWTDIRPAHLRTPAVGK
jgi:MbtH protein